MAKSLVCCCLVTALTLHRAASILIFKSSTQTGIASSIVTLFAAESMKALISLLVLYIRGRIRIKAKKCRQDVANQNADQEKPFLEEEDEGIESDDENKEIGTWEEVQTQLPRYFASAQFFLIQNFLFLIAAQYLTPCLFQACWQIRLITTAIFSCLILGTRVSFRQWICMAGIIAGIIMIKSSQALQSGDGFSLDVVSGLIMLAGATISGGYALVRLQQSLLQFEATGTGTRAAAASDPWIALLCLALSSAPVLVPSITIFLLQSLFSSTASMAILSTSALQSLLAPSLALALLAFLNTFSTKYGGAILTNICGALSILVTDIFIRIVGYHPAKDDTSVDFKSADSIPLLLFGTVVIIASTYIYLTVSDIEKQDNSYRKDQLQGDTSDGQDIP